MSTVVVSRRIALPVAKVWSALSDFGEVYRYSAGVESSPINSGTPPSGVGAERHCHLYDGNHLQERVTESLEHRKLSVEIFESSMPLKTADATFTLAPSPGGGTDVTVTMEYVVKYGPLGLVMDALMMRRAMTRSFDGLLAGLDHHLSTGETVGQGWSPAERVQ